MKNILTIGMAIALIPGTGQAQSSVRFQDKGQQGRFVNVDPAELTSVPV